MALGSLPLNTREGRKGSEQLRLRRETLQCLVDQCKRGLEILRNADGCFDSDGSREGGDSASVSSSPDEGDPEITELYDLLNSRVESTNSLDKLGSIHMSDLQDMAAEDGDSWEVVSKVDFWDGCIDGENESDRDAYVLVRQEDVMEGIACFMAAHILSLKQTKLSAKHSL